jgi:sporulation protein YunB
VNSGEFQYERLISFEKDNSGMITAVKSNMPEFNRLQSAILEPDPGADLRGFHPGSLHSGGQPDRLHLLAGRGPLITVRMQSVGSSTARLENEFTSAGINQTKHQILLDVDVYVSILLPGFATATKVSNSFTVAETVIVGSVPDSTPISTPDPLWRRKPGTMFSTGTEKGTDIDGRYGEEMKQLREQLNRNAYLYYVLDAPTMPDYEYDHAQPPSGGAGAGPSGGGHPGLAHPAGRRPDFGGLYALSSRRPAGEPAGRVQRRRGGRSSAQRMVTEALGSESV